MSSGNETQFLNVDLDIYSRSQLDSLAEALGNKVFVQYLGREKGRYSAHLSLSSNGKTVDVLIRHFATLIKKLPNSAKKLWNSASSREFNIGIQCGLRPESHEIQITESALTMLSELKASIVVTTYAARPARRKRT